jgi:hypothetical protein
MELFFSAKSRSMLYFSKIPSWTMLMKKTTFLLVNLLILPLWLLAQGVPSPKSHFGFDVGEPYMLANFSQTEAYFKKVDAASDRVLYTSIGKTEFGREQPMLIITAPKNFAQLDRYKEISQKLGRAEITESEARALQRR